MSGLTLHELGAERRVLDQFLVETEGEETPEIKGLLDELTGNTITKIQNCGLYLTECAAEVAALKDEEQRLAARRVAIENGIARFKRYLLTEMEAQNLPLVRTPKITVAIQENPAKVVGEVDDDTLRSWANDLAQPTEYATLVREVPAKFELDRRRALALYNATGELPPQLAVVREKGLRIR